MKKKSSQVEEDEDKSQPDNLSMLSDEITALQLRLDDIASAQEQLAELIAQMTTQEEALAHGLRVVSARFTRLLWVSGTAVVIASVAIVLVLVL